MKKINSNKSKVKRAAAVGGASVLGVGTVGAAAAAMVNSNNEDSVQPVVEEEEDLGEEAVIEIDEEAILDEIDGTPIVNTVATTTATIATDETQTEEPQEDLITEVDVNAIQIDFNDPNIPVVDVNLNPVPAPISETTGELAQSALAQTDIDTIVDDILADEPAEELLAPVDEPLLAANADEMIENPFMAAIGEEETADTDLTIEPTDIADDLLA